MSQGQPRRIPVQEAVLTSGGVTYKVQLWDGGVNLFIDRNRDGVFQPSETLYSSVEIRRDAERFRSAGIQGHLVGAVLMADYRVYRQAREALNSSERWDGKLTFTSGELADLMERISDVMDKETEALDSRHRPPALEPTRERPEPTRPRYRGEERAENDGPLSVPNLRSNGADNGIA